MTLRYNALFMPVLAVALLASAVLSGVTAGCGEDETSEPVCDGLLLDTPCLDCVATNCCAQVSDCLGDTRVGGCADCVAGDKASCGDMWTTLYQCGEAACSEECAPELQYPSCDAPATPPSGGSCVSVTGNVKCSPITNEGCSAGEACDYHTGFFECFEAGPRTLCEPCGEAEGFCAAGLSCWEVLLFEPDGIAIENRCAKPCCDDGDCGSGVCTVKVKVDGSEAGLCMGGNTTPTSSGGSAGGPGAGAGGGSSGGSSGGTGGT